MSTPSHHRYVEADSDLVTKLHALSKCSPKLVKSTAYKAPADPNISLRSWKMNEFKYYQVPSPFPTLARGLFTIETINEDAQVEHRIVVRGYDKFYNIGEVPWTSWDSIKAQTSAPYVLTLKSNGCIIFLGALTPDKLVVTSKHSLGPGNQEDKSHAVVGERWLQRHLENVGKTKECLAKVLWDNNWTAIAELCDDSFEEHVLGYPPERSGLHLHGLNACSKEFRTMSSSTVDGFAEEYGFIKTQSKILASIEEVKAFTDECATTGKWNGEAIEGFVVRTHIADYHRDSKTDENILKPSESPYPAGSTFFFKIKFDEPYMMYRDWREITKSLLSVKGSIDNVKITRKRLDKHQTKVYVDWVKREMKRDMAPFEGFNEGHNIIATRERFLEWCETVDGKEAMTVNTNEAAVPVDNKGQRFGKTVIIPVAVPGCGKTAISLAIADLFGFGHTQSDDIIKKKKPAPVFVRNIENLLEKHDVVIADRNNHLTKHREEIRAGVKHRKPPVRLLAWDWAIDIQSPVIIHQICSDRISDRGERHQKLRADPVGNSHENVVWMFIDGFESLRKDEVDEIVEMDIAQSLEAGLQKAIDSCVNVLGVERPSQQSISEALKRAMVYDPHIKEQDKAEKNDSPDPRYYGILPEVNLTELIGSRMSENDVSLDDQTFWKHITSGKRVTTRPHITIVHSKTRLSEKELWQNCIDVQQLLKPPIFRFKLGQVLWNSRVMAVTVEDIVVDSFSDLDQKAQVLVSHLPHELRNCLHITVGTRDGVVKASEAIELVKMWRKHGTSPDIRALSLTDVVSKGRLKGLFK